MAYATTKCGQQYFENVIRLGNRIYLSHIISLGKNHGMQVWLQIHHG